MEARVTITGTVDFSQGNNKAKIKVERIYLYFPAGVSKDRIRDLKVILELPEKHEVVFEKVDSFWISGYLKPLEK